MTSSAELPYAVGHYNIVTFAEHGGETTLTLRARVVKATAAAAPMLAGMEAGWSQSLERLDRYLARR